MNIDQRVERLEKSNRRYRVACTFAVLAGVIGCTMAMQKPIADELQVRKLLPCFVAIRRDDVGHLDFELVERCTGSRVPCRSDAPCPIRLPGHFLSFARAMR